ncbi:MAG: exodeoxyribonuclease VII small subunit [Eubacterium sp.]
MSNKEMTYEQAIERLEEITSKLNDSETTLDESLALFEEGTRLTAFCTKKLESAKQKIIEIEKD